MFTLCLYICILTKCSQNLQVLAKQLFRSLNWTLWPFWNFEYVPKSRLWFYVNFRIVYILATLILVLRFFEMKMAYLTISSEAWRPPSPSQSPRDPPTFDGMTLTPILLLKAFNLPLKGSWKELLGRNLSVWLARLPRTPSRLSQTGLDPAQKGFL